jgi:hypothetical protein
MASDFDDMDRLVPFLQSTQHANSEHAVAVMDPWPVNTPLQNSELVAQRNALQSKALAVLSQEAIELQESEDAKACQAEPCRAGLALASLSRTMV